MATLVQIQTLVDGNPTLKQYFKAARLQAAWDVYNEPADAPNHAARLVWARKVANGDGETDLDREFLRFLALPSIQGTKGASAAIPSVAAVQAAVDSLVNEFAGTA